MLLILYIILERIINFAYNLNIHKNANASKSSTFNLLSDKFSSLDNNLLKLNGSKQPFISKPSTSDSLSISTSVDKLIHQSFTF